MREKYNEYLQAKEGRDREDDTTHEDTSKVVQERASYTIASTHDASDSEIEYK